MGDQNHAVARGRGTDTVPSKPTSEVRSVSADGTPVRQIEAFWMTSCFHPDGFSRRIQRVLAILGQKQTIEGVLFWLHSFRAPPLAWRRGRLPLDSPLCCR